MKKIQVMVAEDHNVVRDGVISILNRAGDMVVVAEAKDGIEAVDRFQEFHPDVSVLDLEMPRLGGLEAIRKIINHAADARIVVLTTYAGDDRIHRALAAGASAYLIKDTLADVLLDAIRKVHAGGSFVDPAVAAELAQRSMSGPSLSDRETEVLRMISAGRSNKEIAAALFVAESTVKTHVASIYDKLKVTDRTEAVVRAIQRGIIRV
ncbi:MAG TPA: response regulator transcription factor [Chthoniobacterales bacterium]